MSETGAPDFLGRQLMEKSLSPPELEGRLAAQSLVSKFDFDGIGPEALLFQAGFLTIAAEEPDDRDAFYRPDYPSLQGFSKFGLARRGGKGQRGGVDKEVLDVR